MTHRALRFFDDLLFESPEVCSHCYSRIRDREEHDPEQSYQRLGTGNHPTETLERSGVGVLGIDIEDKNKHGSRQATTSRTYCSECGTDRGRARGDHIHSAYDAQRICDRLVRRLHERGWYPDVDVLYQTVEHLKSQPDYQGQDREIFATAVWLASHRHGSEARDVPSRVPIETPLELIEP
jgi:hypothetical protein